MKLRCEPGQTAIVVKSVAGNEGKVLTVRRFVGKIKGWQGDDRWEVDIVMRGKLGGFTNTARDCDLRPLRDSDGEDETFTWAGKPEEVKA